MLMAQPHPDASDIHAYGRGLLDSLHAARIEEHVAACESCCRILETVPADGFLTRLRDCRRTPGAHPEEAARTRTDIAAVTFVEAPPVPPELLDHPRYHVLGLIGQGGMGAVYRAEHRRMGRIVALKVLNPALVRNPTSVSRFQQEVRTAAQLTHPNIVTAHDADEAG